MRGTACLFFAGITFLVGRMVLMVDVLASDTIRSIEMLITYGGPAVFLWAIFLSVGRDRYQSKVDALAAQDDRS